MSKPICIYTSYCIRYPLGGHVLAELHNIVGLQRCGYEVIVVEESGGGWAPCFDPARGEMTTDPTYGIRELETVLRPHGLEHNWCYVDSEKTYRGIPADQLRDLCRRSALLFSRAGVNWLNEFYECKKRVLIDTDPGFTQFGMSPQPNKSCPGYASPYDFHHHFTYGERIGRPDCPIPSRDFNWLPTRQPIVTDLVPVSFTPAAKFFTTVMSWSSRKPIVWEGEAYGQKDIEFRRIINLPKRCGPIFQIALAGPKAPREEIAAAGWNLINAIKATETVPVYRDFIARSRGEFSVAVNLEVKARSGWFSDRTASYLAMGKPAVVQDTMFSEFLPCGEGLFGWRSEDDVAMAVEQINADYPAHCQAAARIAREYFDAQKVFGDLLRRCDSPVVA